MERGLSKNELITVLTKSPHGKLSEYTPVVQAAAKQQPEFLAHLIAWDRLKGQIRDSRVAIPVASLSVLKYPEELAENSLAHLTLLNPRELLRAYNFALELRLPNRMKTMRRLVESYLRVKEANTPKFERLALTHRKVLKQLYALVHAKPADAIRPFIHSKDEHGNRVPYPAGSIFEKVSQLKLMSAAEAAGTIMQYKIPFLVAHGALGARAKETDLLLALINAMTPSELTNHMKMLEKMGVKNNPALRGALNEALAKASKGTANLLKATKAVEEIDDEDTKEQLRGLQDKQIEKFGGVDGNWLVLGDKSGSMHTAIQAAREVASVLTAMVKGKVWLIFFDTAPNTLDVTGQSLDRIEQMTRHVNANGGTSIGCGLLRMLDEHVEVDGIAIVSDGEENRAPDFAGVYKQYSEKFGKQVPVYFYQVGGGYSVNLPYSMQRAGFDLQTFDLRGGHDYYSLPNLVKTMRTSRYGLSDEIMATRLLKLTDNYKILRKEAEVHA